MGLLGEKERFNSTETNPTKYIYHRIPKSSITIEDGPNTISFKFFGANAFNSHPPLLLLILPLLLLLVVLLLRRRRQPLGLDRASSAHDPFIRAFVSILPPSSPVGATAGAGAAPIDANRND